MPASTTILVSAGAQFGNSATAPSALVLLSTLLVCHTARVRPSSAPSPMCGVLTLPAIHGRNHAPLPKAHLAFGGLITCGPWGWGMVGKIKKGKYVYYPCPGYRGKSP